MLQYKRDRLSITPALQFFAGQRYGAPASTYGIAPNTCTSTLGPTAGDPRYNHGAAGGSSYDCWTCGTLTGGIPDPYTGKFDTIGAFAVPMQLQAHLQLAYDITKRVSLVVNLTNLVNDCFGGPARIPSDFGPVGDHGRLGEAERNIADEVDSSPASTTP